MYKIIKELFYDSNEFFELFNKACNIFIKRPLVKNKREALRYFERVNDFFSKENYGEISKILKKQYLIVEKKKDKPKFGNERARELSERIEKNRLKAEKYNKDAPQFADLISSLR